MPAASPLGGGYYIDPFTGKRKKTSAVKPTGAPTTATASAAARQAALQRQNEQYAPPGASTAPTGWETGYPMGTAPNDKLLSVGANFAPSAAQVMNPNASLRQAVTGTTAPTSATISAASAVGTGLADAGNMAGVTNPQYGGGDYNATTQLGKSYRDLMLPTAWDDPEALIDTFYRVYGIDKGSGDYGTMLESADNLGIMYMLQNGEGAFGGNAHFVDWAANRMMDQRRADGVSDSPNTLWQAMIDPMSNSPLNYYLNNPSLTPEDQVNNFMSTMRYGLEQSLPAPILNALMAQVDQMGREFRSLRNTSAGGASFTEYLNSRPGSLPAGW